MRGKGEQGSLLTGGPSGPGWTNRVPEAGVSSIPGKFGVGVEIGIGIEKTPVVPLSLRLILLP